LKIKKAQYRAFSFQAVLLVLMTARFDFCQLKYFVELGQPEEESDLGLKLNQSKIVDIIFKHFETG
jgi:hypothetical protein